MPDLYQRLQDVSREWIARGLPPREQVIACADGLRQWRQTLGIEGLWSTAPRLMTATLDDGIGQGLEIIHRFADAMGMTLIPLGLVQPPEAILTACRMQRPEFLGMTVLQADSEEDLAQIGLHLPPETLLIAGGPAFRYDPEMAMRSGVDFVAADVAHFIDFVLKDPRPSSRKPN